MNFTIKDISDYDINNQSKKFEEIYQLIKNFNDYLYEESYLMEAVRASPEKTFGDAIKQSYDNTKSTTNAAFQAGNKIAKSLGKFYQTSYILIMKCIHFIASTISFILDSITTIPQTIIKCSDKLKSISENVVSKITGDIMIYITHKDIEEFYRENFINYLLQFKNIAELLKNDELWNLTKNTFITIAGKKYLAYQVMFGWNKAYNDKVISTKKIGDPHALQNLGIIPTLEHLSSKMKGVSFTKSKIDMSLIGNRSIYLQHPENKSNDLIRISYNGRTKSYSYYLDAANQLVTDIGGMKNSLKELENELSNKISEVFSQNSAVLHLPDHSQRIINKIVPIIANVFKIVSTVLLYVQKDIDTVDKTIDKIFKYQNKS